MRTNKNNWKIFSFFCEFIYVRLDSRFIQDINLIFRIIALRKRSVFIGKKNNLTIFSIKKKHKAKIETFFPSIKQSKEEERNNNNRKFVSTIS
jgi:hypothetical protein